MKMPTCTALMRTDSSSREMLAASEGMGVPGPAPERRQPAALTLVEMMIAISIVALLVMLAQLNFYGLYRKGTFRGQVQELVLTLEMAARGAAESDRRYEVIIDLTEQTYMLREITSTNVSEILDDEIIVENDLSRDCRFEYVMFDDNESTSDGRAKFRAGKRGWQYGGKIVISDEDENMYSIVVNRLNGIVELKDGDVELLLPRTENEMLF